MMMELNWARVCEEIYDAVVNGMTEDEAFDSACARWNMSEEQCDRMVKEYYEYLDAMDDWTTDVDEPMDDDWDAYVMENAYGPDYDEPSDLF